MLKFRDAKELIKDEEPNIDEFDEIVSEMKKVSLSAEEPFMSPV